jgi:hypothetical protein
MTGEGAKPGGVLHKFGESMRAMNGDNCVFYYEPQGFTPEGICNIMAFSLGLDITFEQIQPYLTQKITNNFNELFESESVEQRAARLAAAEERNRAASSPRTPQIHCIRCGIVCPGNIDQKLMT